MNMSDDPEDKAKDGADYEVGYGRPPKASRFAPGQSGNPRGRPKTPKNFAEAFDKRLSNKVAASENGRRKLVTYREAIVAKAINKAAEGDHKSISLVMKATSEQSARTGGDTAENGNHEDDVALLRQIIASMGISIIDLLGLPPEADRGES